MEQPSILHHGDESERVEREPANIIPQSPTVEVVQQFHAGEHPLVQAPNSHVEIAPRENEDAKHISDTNQQNESDVSQLLSPNYGLINK